jgi:hypothetical protein
MLMDYELIDRAGAVLAPVLPLAAELVRVAEAAIDGGRAWFGRPQPVSIARDPKPTA